MKINIKKLKPEAIIPTYAINGDGAMDLTATSKTKDEKGNVVYGTGLAMEIPVGYVGLIFPRSSVSKLTLNLANSVGVIDAAYRGEIICKFKPTLAYIPSNVVIPVTGGEYEVGERVAQIMIMPRPEIEFNEIEDLSPTERGSGGFGSTGV
jgi:dUTP pyrophosphatase